MAHPVRLRVLSTLRGGELCVCRITALLGLAVSPVSAHLADLKRAGLVEITVETAVTTARAMKRSKRLVTTGMVGLSGAFSRQKRVC
jgi:ArsR family transcriptional regulator